MNKPLINKLKTVDGWSDELSCYVYFGKSGDVGTSIDGYYNYLYKEKLWKANNRISTSWDIAGVNKHGQNSFHYILSESSYVSQKKDTEFIVTKNYNKFDTSFRYEYVKKNNRQQYIESIKASFGLKEALTFKNESLNYSLNKLLGELSFDKKFDALAMQDNQQRTPLHYAFMNVRTLSAIKSLIDVVANFSESQKRELLLIKDKYGKNSFHYLLNGPLNNKFNVIVDDLFKKNELSILQDGLLEGDKNDVTPYHNACARQVNWTCDLDKIHSIIKDKSYLLSTRYTQKNMTTLHYLCRAGNINRIKAVVSTLGDNYASMISAQKNTINGRNVLHEAIATGREDIFYAIFDTFKNNPKKLRSALVERAKGRTGLHFACQYGSVKILRSVINALGPLEVNKIMKNDKKKLFRLVKKNDRIPKETFRRMINRSTCFLDMFQYLAAKRREDGSDGKDYKARLLDFKNLICNIKSNVKNGQHALRTGLKSFTCKVYFWIFKSGQRYHDKRDVLIESMKTITLPERSKMLKGFTLYVDNNHCKRSVFEKSVIKDIRDVLPNKNDMDIQVEGVDNGNQFNAENEKCQYIYC